MDIYKKDIFKMENLMDKEKLHFLVHKFKKENLKEEENLTVMAKYFLKMVLFLKVYLKILNFKIEEE